MTEWISVKNAVPPDNREVLVLHHITDCDYPPSISIGWRVVFKNGRIKWKYNEWCGTSILCIENEKGFNTLTHWMPLPEAPKL